MALSYLTPIDLNKLELLNPRFQFLTFATLPGSPVEGQFAYASDTHLPYVWNGSAWTSMVSAGTGFGAPSFTFSTTNSAGVSGNAIRTDATIAIFDATAPTTSAVADAAAVGTAAFGARRDHVHGREAFGAVTAETTFGGSSANGSAVTISHSDHTHGNPTHVHTDHNAIVLNDLATATGTYSMGGNKLTNLGVATASTDAASLANRLDQFAAPNTDVSWSSHKITSLLDPTTAQDAATKNYVDNVAQGLSPKGSVVVATTTVLPGTYTYANGTAGVGATLTAPGVGILTVDGIALVLNNRILVKNEAAPANNGIYFVSTAGTAGVAAILTRSLDEDDASEVPGSFTFVESGTVNGATGWVIANAGPFTVGTTAQTFTQFSGAGTYVGTAGSITLTGSAFSISTSYIGQSSITTLGTITTGVWNGTTIAVANGGTNATSASVARDFTHLGAATAPTGAGTAGTVTVSNTGIPTKVIATVGDASATAITVTHNLGTRDVQVFVYQAATPWAQVICDVAMTTTNSVTLTFAVAPSASQYNCVIVG